MEKEIGNKKIVVIYHAECRDGFGAAYAAWKKFGNRAEYLPAKYGGEVPELEDKEIYIVDFSFEEEVLKKWVKDNKKVVEIDHHVSAKEKVKAASEYLFDLKHSGAYLAWRYFWPDKKVPLLIKYLEDQDLWNFKLPQTRALTTYINTVEADFKVWKKLETDLEKADRRKEFITKGKFLQGYVNSMVEWMVENRAEEVIFEGKRILAVNNAYKPLTSQLGHALYEKQPDMAIVWSQQGNQRKFSLRSNGKVNVAKIAEKYSGGGHPGAASFSLPADGPLPWKMVK